LDGPVAGDVTALRRDLEFLLGVPATDGNLVEVLRNGKQIFPAMTSAIERAESTVDLAIYAFRSGSAAESIAAALADRAAAGCRVRVLVDGVGSATLDDGLQDRMRSAGVRLAFFRRPSRRSPFKHNHRTHRKVLVVDRAVAFTGGVGISSEWEGDARNPQEWRDTQIRVEGPAVAGLMGAFVQNWSETVGAPDGDGLDSRGLGHPGDQTVQVVRGTASLGWDDIQTAWHTLITAAEDEVCLQTAFFTPDEHFVGLLTDAASRGVQVKLLVPGPHHHSLVSRLSGERYFADLLAAGVHVWVYQPTMLHTKVVTIDRQVAMLGSSNFNRRSMEQDEEVACIFFGGSVPGRLVGDFQDDLTRADEVDPDDWAARPVHRRVVEAATQPLRRFL
jgi:cardiolipin synthase